MGQIIFRGGTILTVDGDLAICDGVIAQVGGEYTPDGADYEIVDCAGCIVMPGLLQQARVHMCQSLARGCADDKVTAVRVEAVR
jgi:cytosine/adenosine deaminase-related metal-dependent hydrolase